MIIPIPDSKQIIYYAIQNDNEMKPECSSILWYTETTINNLEIVHLYDILYWAQNKLTQILLQTHISH